MANRLMEFTERLQAERDRLEERVAELELKVAEAGEEIDTSAQAMVGALNQRKAAEDLATACRNVVNQPLLARDKVQSLLLGALQKYDGAQP